MRPTLDIEILDRYLAGTATSEEIAEVKAWGRDSQEYRDLMADLQADSDSLGRSAVNWDAEQMWNRLETRRAEGLKSEANSSVINAPRVGHGVLISAKAWMVAAATFILALAAVGVTAKFGWNNMMNSSMFSSSIAREIVTARGQRLTIELVDGSRVIVAPESRMSIHKDYGKLNREISIEGEAYFTVASDKQRPFIVKSGEVYTRVLGTSFSVRKYREDSELRVVVTEGRVSVNNAVVGAGDIARVGIDDVISVYSSGNLDSYIGWVTGKFDFVDSPLDSVVRELNRAYDIDIILADRELAGYRITADFDNQTVNQILTDITLATNSSLQYSGRRVFIRKANTSNGESEKSAGKPIRGVPTK